MGLFKRASDIIESKVNRLLDRVEDPSAALDLSYDKMLDGLQLVKRHLADVVTEQKVVEKQIQQAEAGVAERESEARTALKMNREDLAQAALERKHAALEQLQQLREAHEKISLQVERLKESEQKFQERIASFKTQKEVTKASYQAAQAQVRIGESIAGISRELGGVGDTLQRANDKAEQMMGRASAMETLLDEGILEDPLDGRDSVQRELDALKKEAAVKDDLERLRKELKEA
ncbi:PspA/IM30 family protein [Alicyclobacillus dauci]|uniref:PspA/IM30 family protein n=1 Tax=Alicyclobacillus dauci TaxID=1475485 RepID=A0ABY6YZP2_9BACL|nr:PspA/IM30 family protein [Alicyclobacillus dauci]WAH35586.1 PspA/IM30 family protein [Alicyclobacillus dauci]